MKMKAILLFTFYIILALNLSLKFNDYEKPTYPKGANGDKQRVL